MMKQKIKNFNHFYFGIKSRFFGREFFRKNRANQARDLVINPGGMFFLGMGEDSPGLHTDSYDFNDKALKNGIKFLVISTLFFLSKSVFNQA